MKKLYLIIILLLISVNCVFALDKDEYPQYKLEVLKNWANELGNTVERSKIGYINYIVNEQFFTDYELRNMYNELKDEMFFHPEQKKMFFIIAMPGEKKKLDILFKELNKIKDINQYYKKANELIRKKYSSVILIGKFEVDMSEIDSYKESNAIKKLNKGDHSAVGVMPNTYESYILGCLDVVPAYYESFEEVYPTFSVAVKQALPISKKFIDEYNKYELKYN